MYESKTKFGVVLFDDPESPQSGFISYGTQGGKATVKAINGINELPRDTLWWSNIETSILSSGVEGASWLRSDVFLGPKMVNILNEWGIGMEKGGFKREINQKIVNFLANRFNTVMKTATALVYETRKELGLPVNNELDWFRKSMLRGDFATLLPKAELPEGEMVSVIKKDQAYVDWTKTSERYDASHVRLATMIPRGSHAYRMLSTKIPAGEFKYVKADEISQNAKDVISSLIHTEHPFVAEVVINKYHTTQDESNFAFGNSMSKNNTRRSWITSSEFAGLADIADIKVNAAYISGNSSTIGEMLPKAMREFVEDRTTNGRSWTAGVISENIWRAFTVKPEMPKTKRRGVEKPTATIREAWVKSSDKMLTLEVADYLASFGDYKISGYGNGAVQISCLSDVKNDLIMDAVMPPKGHPEKASLPRMSDIPARLAAEEGITWRGEKEDTVIAMMSLYQQKKTIQALDAITLIEDADKRNELVKKLVQEGLGAIKADRAKFER